VAQSVEELTARADRAELTAEGTDEQHCGNCRYYNEMKAEIGYCSHEQVDMVVGEPWWCTFWEEGTT